MKIKSVLADSYTSLLMGKNLKFGIRRPPCSKLSFSNIAWSFNAKSFGKGTKVHANDSGRMAKKAALSTYSKPFKDLLQNQESDDLET